MQVRNRFFQIAAVPLVIFLWTNLSAAQTSLQAAELRCEYRVNPQGIDVIQPRLSWILQPVDPSARGLVQKAYQVLVASSAELLAKCKGDLWDSGKVKSDQSIHIPYAGKLLTSGRACHWKVRVWDAAGQPSAWSQPAMWSMGLLKASDWQAKWIGLDHGELPNGAIEAQWIWFPEGDPAKEASVGQRFFRRTVNLPADRPIKKAICKMTADHEFALYINGKKVLEGNDYHRLGQADATSLLHGGANMLAVVATNKGDRSSPAGLIGQLRIEFAKDEQMVVDTDSQWRTSDAMAAGWEALEFNDSGWGAAKQLGPYGIKPWGAGAGEEVRLPARFLRREFTVGKKVKRATAYICGLGLSELYINGQKVGDHVLSPGCTDYGKRCFYVTHDVTDWLKKGSNALGAILGNGRFFSPRHKVPYDTRTFGYPKLLLQIHIQYKDGTKETIVSDEKWKVTTNGPIRANNEYDGEEYDARMEMPGWDKAGFNDSTWDKVQLVQAPGGAIVPQMAEPMRVTEKLKPVAISNPQPGIYIFDMGQNMVGWCRLKVRGPTGTVVTLRHAEILDLDGTLSMANLRSAKATDVYTLQGQGEEIFEPRFTYHGFRYVEVKGFPGTPTLAALEGCVVHDDVPPAGEFTCSNELINRICNNIIWCTRGNYRSMPTDCPQRDERLAWLGDRSEASRGETYFFKVAPLYSKWMTDIMDSQKENGSVPDVAPNFWQFYTDNVTWPSSYVIIPGHLYLQYTDLRTIQQHYPTMKKWIDYMAVYMKDGLMPRDNYGDWCMPRKSPHQIDSKDPSRQTSKEVLGTTYFYHDLCLMACYARLLGKADDAVNFDKLAAELKATFNQKLFNKETAQYDNGTQTSSVLALAFGMVPQEQRARVSQTLADNIVHKSNSHVGTGLVGGQWLMRVLSNNGREDLAYILASNEEYPSWGYMVRKNATTFWELWNGDTATPDMNSHNHVMLVGDLGIWFFECLAGIAPDLSRPGFKHIIMRPRPTGDLKFVKASHESMYGTIRSDWKLDGDRFTWNVTVPANTAATLYVPAKNASAVTEGGKAAGEARGVQFLRMEKETASGIAAQTAVFEVRSGDYTFFSLVSAGKE